MLLYHVKDGGLCLAKHNNLFKAIVSLFSNFSITDEGVDFTPHCVPYSHIMSYHVVEVLTLEQIKKLTPNLLLQILVFAGNLS